MTTTLEIEGLGKVLFCHATPRNETEIFTRLTPEDRLAPVFKDVDASVVVCGHTHMQFDRTVGRLRVVNAGSVGMPFGTTGADWLLLGPGIELRKTNYDTLATAEQFRRTAFPMVEEIAVKYILQLAARAGTPGRVGAGRGVRGRQTLADLRRLSRTMSCEGSEGQQVP